MRLKLIFIGCLIVSPAMAQEQSSQPSEYVLKITPQDLDLMGKALGTMPYNDIAPLLQKLRSQVVEQQHPKKAEKEPKKVG